MPACVVYALEVIQISYQNRGATIFTTRAGKLAGQHIEDHTTVQKTCQRILCCLEPHFFSRFDQLVFELEYPQPRAQSSRQLRCVERLNQVIVCSGLQPLYDVSFRFLRCEKDHMHIRLLAFFAYPAADSRPVQLWHNPVQQRETWSILSAQVFSG